MFIGHYAAAEILLSIDKTIPVLPVAVGVAYPDLIWPVLVLFNKEKVLIDPATPLQRGIRFVSYPYSHSLVLSTLLTVIPSLVVALLYRRPMAGLFFLLAALSHWLLDTLVHLPDLPVKGFGKDRMIGLGLWRYPKFTFVFEYAFFAAATMLFAPADTRLKLLAGAFVLHLLNANSFFSFTKTNPVKAPGAYAVLAFVGFGLAIIGFSTVWHS